MTSNSSLLGAALPEGVALVERFGPDRFEGLDPTYIEQFQNAVAKRRNEFAAGRACAHAALGILGAGVDHIGRRANGAPAWPAGVTGTVTHCDGYVAAAVSLERLYLGIDAEPAADLPGDTARMIAFDQELQWIAETTLPTRLLFCAKEAVYKAWSNVTGDALTFSDARLTFRDTDFYADLITRPTAPTLKGRFHIDHGLIGTIIAQPV